MVHSKGVNVLKADMSVAKYKLEKIIDEINKQGMTFYRPAFIYPDGKMLYADGRVYP